ncbi:PHD-finger and DNA binding domain-containing protein [Actinidia rufa]|uniref:PHD-finger and DNA binding domain-containing protein n=1 Tax=Actinidia rufa TaxID=165716 RepID=A0A7J0DBV9_9ERIC|nr:PHD-finger and DNA binding domain-containing protein [Actinidia rufa]
MAASCPKGMPTQSYGVMGETVTGLGSCGIHDRYSALNLNDSSAYSSFTSAGGPLWVSDSCDDESTYQYYSRNDMTFVIEALKSSDTLYRPMLLAISKQWNMFNSSGTKSDVDCHNPITSSELMKGQMLHLAPSETCAGNEISDEGKPRVNSIAAQYSGITDCEVSALVNNNPVIENNFGKMENQLTSSDESAETSKAAGIQNFVKTGNSGSNRSVGTSNDSEIQGKILSVGDSSLTSTDLDAEQGRNIESADCGHMTSTTETKNDETSQGLLGTSYVNYYSFARTATLVAEELTQKSSDKISVGSTKPDDIILAQLKAISKKATKFYWPNIQNLNADARKERCGWCFSCKAPDDDRDCFLNMNDSAPVLPSEVVGLHSKWNKIGHLIDVMCYILCIEERLRGFLLGPWLNPHYSNLWRKSVVKASDVASLKHLLLVLESNLRRLALSAEWLKHVDSVATMGSASHVVTSSKYRKRTRYLDLEPKPLSKAAAGLGLFWWRGGRISRELFKWKVCPRSLASKAARQAGCTKIPGVLYPDSSEFANRSKYVVWRAAVETSRSVEQLALQIRELDANIRWDDIENTNLLSKMDQFRKSVRPFKKVIIRRKCTEGTVLKYLLDFGKRRIIPDIVVTHGSMVEESSSGRKKYWLDEPHVPLHLVKAFEDRRIARKSNKISSGKLHARGGITKKTSKKRGFSYLFAKAEKSEKLSVWAL